LGPLFGGDGGIRTLVLFTNNVSDYTFIITLVLNVPKYQV